MVEAAVYEGGRGPFAAHVLQTDRPSPLAATNKARRLRLGEPECTGGCCGFLTAVVQRRGGLVVWSGWEGPRQDHVPPDFHFDAEQYDAELARALADRWWDIYTDRAWRSPTRADDTGF
ncbi:hypothetical protein [Streptomyces melanogenes]|uniref:hypothetical protein n=1 Tax=Streptomyces melanogenes TaxID=67326 RepID=UPI001E49BDEA|nr:hypothetical protein [Streptomyces melanogenes]